MKSTKLVMVADDDQALRESVCELLEEDGFRAISVASGTAALSRLRTGDEKPDLILLDLMMPGMNGWQFREAQLADPALAKIPVVVMTASRDLGGIKADEVVHKPIRLARLMEVVDRFTRRGKRDGAPSRLAKAMVGAIPTPPPIRALTPAPQTAVISDGVLSGGGDAGSRMRGLDWAATPLGPLHLWSQSLRSAVSICLGASFPIAIYWGQELAVLYNDAWSVILGRKHPWAMAKPARQVWPEIWEAVSPLFEQVMTTGEASFREESLLPIERHGFPEECYFDFNLSPIRGEGGHIEGVFNAVIESTYRVVSERRNRLLRDLAQRIAAGRQVAEVCAIAAKVLGNEPLDVPFSALYLADKEKGTARLVGVSGLAPGSPATPVEHSLDDGPWPLGAAQMAGAVQIIDRLDKRFSERLPGGPWPEPTTSALVAPLTPMGLGESDGESSGFLVVGVSPRRGTDDPYRHFVERAANTISAALGNVNVMEAERKRAEGLAEIDRAKTVFFGNVSHEFRTPLTLMLGPIEEMLSNKGIAPEAQRRSLELLHRNALRMQKLVNALLDFARLEAGRQEVSYEPIDIGTSTRELASAFESAMERAGLTFTIASPALAEPVYVDREMWEKIVLNLVSNALKFTFKGHVSVSTKTTDTHVALEVRDTGGGIPEEALPRIFERFHRVEGTKARTNEGSGIGLALVSELVRLHGGRIEVDSEIGRGTKFTVSIPKGTTHLPKDRIGVPRAQNTLGAQAYVNEANLWLPRPSHTPSPFDSLLAPAPGADALSFPINISPANDYERIRSERLLVVDDNGDMREYLRTLLGQRWIIEVAENGAQALTMADKRPPDLVVTDVMMPELDGFGLLRGLRAGRATSAIPVIMLSARAGEEARIEGLEAGADDYLIKPFSARELVARVQTHLELARLRRAAEDSSVRLHDQLMQAPLALSVVSGPDFVFQLANGRYLEIVGGRDVLGKPFRTVFPDAPGYASVLNMLEQVYATGLPFSVEEYCVPLSRRGNGILEDVFFKFTCQPIRDAGGKVTDIMTVATEVTDLVMARRRIEQSEEMFRCIVAQVQAGIAQTDLAGRIRLVNDRYREIVGRSPTELRQLKVEDFTHADDVANYSRLFARLIDQGIPFMTEQRYVKPDGSIVWTQNSVSRLDDREGRPQGSVTVTVDVTQRTFSERAVKESEERFRSIFDASAVSIWDADFTEVKKRLDQLKAEHGAGLRMMFERRPVLIDEVLGLLRIRDVNPATLRMFGATKKQELIENFLRIVVPGTKRIFLELLMALAEGRRIFTSESPVQTFAGERFDVAVTIGLPDPSSSNGGGGYERLLVNLLDISPQKLVDREREAHAADLERAVRFSEMFVGILGHDLRNPLSAITTAANLLETRSDAEKITRPVARILAGAERMDRMITQLLDFTRIRIGRGIPLECGRIDLGEVTQAIIDELVPVRQRDIRLETRGDVIGTWDSDRMSQLLSNLAANACQHGTAGLPILIEIDGSEPDTVRLEVRNRGVIPPDLLPMLFEPFRRHTSDLGERRDGSSGLGLGLYITQQIVVAHGGGLDVRSNDLEGTRFIIELPRHVTPAAEDEPNPPAPTPSLVPTTRPHLDERTRGETPRPGESVFGAPPGGGTKPPRTSGERS